MIVDIPPIEKSAAARYFRQQGKEIGEMLSLRQQIGHLKKLRKSMSPEVFQALLTPLETRLAKLREEK